MSNPTHHRITDSWPYNHLWGNSENDLSICADLESMLPHGSGIDYKWDVELKRNGKVYASNSFHAMNEWGTYCHIYDFTAVYKYNGFDAREECRLCKGEGIRLISDLANLRHESEGQTIKFLRLQFPDNLISDSKFLCNYCDGNGYLRIKPFTLERVNFHGQRIHDACGFGLRDYLEELLSESSLYYQVEEA